MGSWKPPLHFVYDKIKVPAATSQVNVDHIYPFVTSQGILARNLTEEQKIIEDLFQDFVFDPVARRLCREDRQENCRIYDRGDSCAINIASNSIAQKISWTSLSMMIPLLN